MTRHAMPCHAAALPSPHRHTLPELLAFARALPQERERERTTYSLAPEE